MTTDFNKLAIFNLSHGAHASAETGVCAMEAVAWLEGLPHTDHPSCTCQIIAAYVRTLNDRLPHDQRQRLVPYLPRLVGTVSPPHEWQRAQYLVSQAFGKVWPIVFSVLKMKKHAVNFEQIGKEWQGAARAAIAALAALADHADHAVRVAAAIAARAAIAALAALADHADHAELAVRVAAAIAAHAALAVHADRAVRADLYQVHFDMLDGVLAIGAPSLGFSKPIEPRVAAYRELIEA